MRRRLPAVGLALALSLGGCASYSPHHGARLTPPHTTERTLSADALVVDRGFGPQLLGVPEFALSRGLDASWDLGGRVYPLGIEVMARHRLLAKRDYRVTLMPLVAVSQVSATNPDTSFAEVTAGGVLMHGIRLSPSLELSLGFRSQARLGLNAVAVREDFGAARWGVLAGGSATLRWPLSAHSALEPGLLVLAPYDIDRETWDFPICQGGVALSW